MSLRPVREILSTKPTIEGAGVKLQRAFGFGKTKDFDPFLLLDDFPRTSGLGRDRSQHDQSHRQLLKRLENVQAVTLDTAYGFQANVPQMTEKILEYFATSLRLDIKPLHFTSYEDSTEVERAASAKRCGRPTSSSLVRAAPVTRSTSGRP